MPKIEHRFDEPTLAREAATKAHVLDVFATLAKASNGRIVNTSEGDYLDHPGGGCRMGTDPATSVCDSYGRTHDHENLFVVGAPTTPTGGCTNGTLTFVALTLRSAHEIAARELENLESDRILNSQFLIHFAAVSMISTAASAPIRPAPTVARAGKSLPNASRYDVFMSLNFVRSGR